MRLGFRCHIIGLAALVITAPVAAGAVLHVDASRSTGANNGSSWNDAFQGPLGLQAALAVAASGTELWIADGRYTPAPPNGDRNASFVLPGGVALYGGFAGDETAFEERNVALNLIILSGDLNGDDTPSGLGTGENSLHVLRAVGRDSTSIVDGLTLRDGRAGGPAEADKSGANVLVLGGSPTFRNCTITAGSASRAGGGMLLDNASANVSDCRFVDNIADMRGGAAAHQAGGASHFTRCRFEANRGGNGCGLYNGPSDMFSSDPGGAPVLTDCDFVDNLGFLGTASGIGIFDLRGTPRIERCRFVNNTTPAGGGGLYLARSAAEVRDCEFFANAAPGDGGGGVYLDAQWGGGPWAMTESNFVNCLFANNNGAIFVQVGSHATMVNCSLVNNSVGIPFLAWPAAFCGNDASLVLHNCIVWGNQPAFSSGLEGVLLGLGNALIQVEHCDVQLWEGNLPGTGTFAADPLFVDPNGPDGDPSTWQDSDYRLKAGSPCLDAGQNSAVPEGVSTDLDGHPRFMDDPASPDCPFDPGTCGTAPIADLGVSVFQPMSFLLGDLNCDGSINADDTAAFVLALTDAAAYQAAYPDCDSNRADMDGSGIANGQDIQTFVNTLVGP